MTAPAVQSGPLTVLVVDDEELVRRYTARALENEGYHVIEAGNGLEALALLEATDTGVDLVITDVVMPLLTGRELAHRLAARPAPPPIIFVSGSHGISDIPGQLLEKPFLPSELNALVRWVLSRPSPAGARPLPTAPGITS